ncbi:tetratricopeptide repeat protein [Kordiimonas pumila]|uniref:Tetratricopeptide repeat protein n=1 Tax=Kordiimonas pumila TaxID=2161677 RepID=A0ABV7D9Y4_9PROT|nr:hypothetical protein [Kordiimonas pumila]
MSRNNFIKKSIATFCFTVTGWNGVCADAGEDRYIACLDMAAVAPDKAINEALVWQTSGGGVPARHCEAIGLFHLHEYGEAAMRFELIAEDMRVGKGMPVRDGKRLTATAAMLADMYDQAANAWLLADEIVRAENAVDLALSLVPEDSQQELDLILDRARIAAADGDYVMALEDIEYIRLKDASRTDLLVFLAASARGTKHYAKADAAITEYLALYPNDPAGYLERGNLYDATGKAQEARLSWLKVIELSPDSVDADAARANLERLDMKRPEIKEIPTAKN